MRTHKSFKQISFPKDEVSTLKDQEEIITHRVSKEKDVFQKGDLVQTPWKDVYLVADRIDLTSGDESPYAQFLTPEQKAEISKHGAVAVLKLRKQLMPTVPVIESSSSYERPYPLDVIRKVYGNDVYSRLKDDPVHRWRADTGIELIHKEPTRDEFERIVANWNLMTPEQKKKSDEFSMKQFGKNNLDRIDAIRKEYSNVSESAIQGFESLSEDELKRFIMDGIRERMAENDVSDSEAEIVDIAVIGSRTKGKARGDSDLDVVVEYSGRLREDDFFNILHSETEDGGAFEINGVEIDVNPIRKEETGTLEDYLKKSDEYWAKKLDESSADKFDDLLKNPTKFDGSKDEQAFLDTFYYSKEFRFAWKLVYDRVRHQVRIHVFKLDALKVLGQKRFGWREYIVSQDHKTIKQIGFRDFPSKDEAIAAFKKMISNN